MGSRETILANIAQSLKGLTVANELPKVNQQQQSLSVSELLDRFGKEFKKINCEMVSCKNYDDAVRTICSMLGESRQLKLMLSKNSLLIDNGFESKIKNANQNISIVPYHREVSSADVSVVVASYAIAETSTVVLRSSPSQFRSLALLPETVFVIAKESELRLSMEEVLTEIKHQSVLKDTSALIFVTGSSRTSDIEKTLVLGVHGPKRLVVIFVP